MAKKPAPAAKPKTRGRLLALLLVLLLVASAGWLTYDRLQTPLPILTGHALYVTAPGKPTTTLVWPTSGEAALGATGYGVLAINGAQKVVPTASVAKLITALAVLKVKPLAAGQQGPMLTLSQSDVDLYNSYVAQDGSVTAVADGEQISEYQALQAMLLPSSNNMADSLAVWAFGSLSAYADYANKQLASWELNHSHVGSDASGFSPTTTSTASDLVKLGQQAVANSVVANIASQSTADIPVAGTVHNVNWLLGTNGINGLKTGNSEQAGGVFLFSAPYAVPGGPTVTIIGAVMNAPSLQQAMSSGARLLASAQTGFTMSSGLLAGQAVGYYNVPWGMTVTAVTKALAKSLVWQGKALDTPVIHLTSLVAPQASGTRVGSAGFSGSTPTPVVLSQPIPAPSLWWRLQHN